MEGCVSLCICKFTKKDVGKHVFSFQQNKAKTDDILRQPTRTNTKSAEETPFYPTERPAFATSTLFALTQPVYSPAGGTKRASVFGARTFNLDAQTRMRGRLCWHCGR
jgi:hypothetical protein